MLITDYSSIYTDYLLLNRPVAFFAYDYEYYVNQNREIQFDYDWITPGPNCYNQTELEREILKVLINGQDDYIQKRKEIMDLAFKYQDGNSSERIWQCVRDFF
jgi:CDP-glycerol glycerophosphotransferase